METLIERINDAMPSHMVDRWERDDVARDTNGKAYVERWYSVNQVTQDGQEYPVFIRVVHEDGTIIREEPLAALATIRGR